jgi:hypothetical protein
LNITPGGLRYWPPAPDMAAATFYSMNSGMYDVYGRLRFAQDDTDDTDDDD